MRISYWSSDVCSSDLNWQARRFNLPQAIAGEIRKIGEHETVVVMHNDAVVQGLRELPRMREVERWGVLTIGTGLGNARFTKIGRASCRERGGQSVKISVVAVSLKKKQQNIKST